MGFNGTMTPQNDPVNTSTFFFSTADVYLNTFSSYIRSTSRILVDFTYNFVFSYWRYYTSGTDQNTNNNVISFSTLLLYNYQPDIQNPILDTFTAATVVSDPMDVIAQYASNSITRRQQFQVSTIGLLTHYNSPLQLYHRFDACTFGTSPGTFHSGLASTDTKVLYSSTNSVFVTIQN